MYRYSAIPAIAVGCLIGWLVAAWFFIRIDVASPFVAVFFMYLIIAWDLRWWHESRLRLPVAIMGGGILFLFFQPRVHGRFLIDDIGDLLQPYGPFSHVNWAMCGAAIVSAVVLIVTPLNPYDADYFRGIPRRDVEC